MRIVWSIRRRSPVKSSIGAVPALARSENWAGSRRCARSIAAARAASTSARATSSCPPGRSRRLARRIISPMRVRRASTSPASTAAPGPPRSACARSTAARTSAPSVGGLPAPRFMAPSASSLMGMLLFRQVVRDRLLPVQRLAGDRTTRCIGGVYTGGHRVRELLERRGKLSELAACAAAEFSPFAPPVAPEPRATAHPAQRCSASWTSR